MPFHWCADETLMLMTMIPFIGIFFRRLHTWWHNKFDHKCHECEEHHVEHKEYSPFDREDFHKVSEEDMEYLRGEPAPLNITIPITIEKNDQDK